jgi:hypothetical protein
VGKNLSKTGKSKTRLFGFWREQKTDEISIEKFVGPNFNHGHQSIPLRLVLLAVLSGLVRKRCGGKFSFV